MQLHDILLLRTSAILPEAISAGGLTPTTDISLFLTTYRGRSHLPADIKIYNNLLTVKIPLYVAGNIPIPFRLLIAFTICPFPI